MSSVCNYMVQSLAFCFENAIARSLIAISLHISCVCKWFGCKASQITQKTVAILATVIDNSQQNVMSTQYSMRLIGEIDDLMCLKWP